MKRFRTTWSSLPVLSFLFVCGILLAGCGGQPTGGTPADTADETVEGKTSENGTAADGTAEGGTAVDGTVEDGTAVDGTVEGGTAADGTVGNEFHSESEPSSSRVADASEMAAVEDVVPEGLEPVYGSSLRDGSYSVTVDSSSSMFRITDCVLTVSDGELTAVLTMGGTGYRYVYPGTAEEAAIAPESEYIPCVENASGAHTFTIPVSALDTGVPCAAFSRKKNLWYSRTLRFRADSLPLSAYAEGVLTTAVSLGLADGAYTVEAVLSGGSGRASIQSPVSVRVRGGEVTANLIWNSDKYDYMVVDGTRRDADLRENGQSRFTIPVAAFDIPLPVLADTTAMSQPHEIEYTLLFQSDTIQMEPEQEG